MPNNSASAAVRNPSHPRKKRSHHRREKRKFGDSSHGVDSISSLPDLILLDILSYLPTKFVIRTSLLSKRWYHVWSRTPSLSFDKLDADSINETLARYKAPKMTSFQLCTRFGDHLPNIELAMSRNVDSVLLDLNDKYDIPEFFYINSSLEELSIVLHYFTRMAPSCSVSWTSLKKLSISSCQLPDECMAKILSGCPILESLILNLCRGLEVLDLRGLMSLRTLEIYSGLKQIVAPHIHRLRLKISQPPCTLVDVSSLNEAELDMFFNSLEQLKPETLDMVLHMLEKLKNVEKLTLGSNVLKILSLAELRSVPFPSFKVKYMMFETVISQYVIPGVVRMLQNSPELKKLTLHPSDSGTFTGENLNRYLNLHGLNPDQCWSTEARAFDNISRWNPETEQVTSFMKLMLKNTKTLEKIVVEVGNYLKERNVKKLLEMVPVLCDKDNVSIVIKP